MASHILDRDHQFVSVDGRDNQVIPIRRKKCNRLHGWAREGNNCPSRSDSSL
jgi:hypothetical protein